MSVLSGGTRISCGMYVWGEKKLLERAQDRKRSECGTVSEGTENGCHFISPETVNVG